MQLSRGVLVASIQVDLDEDTLGRFKTDLLDRIQESGARAVILDLSGMDTLDSVEFAALRRIIQMARIMGTGSVLAGLKPGIVAALIDTGTDIEGVVAARNLDHAYQLIEAPPDLDPDEEGEEEAGSEADLEEEQEPDELEPREDLP